jgi:hypothetical protein
VRTARFEQGLAGLVELRNGEGDSIVGQHVPMQIETDAEFFHEGISAVKHGHIAAAADGQGGIGGFEPVLFSGRRRINFERDALAFFRDRQQRSAA